MSYGPFSPSKNVFLSIFLKKIGVLDSYFIHRYIIIKCRSSLISGKICQLLYRRVMVLFSTSFFAKCLHVSEDGPGWGHLFHTDIFLVFSCIFCLKDCLRLQKKAFQAWKSLVSMRLVGNEKP